MQYDRVIPTKQGPPFPFFSHFPRSWVLLRIVLDMLPQVPLPYLGLRAAHNTVVRLYLVFLFMKIISKMTDLERE